MLNNWTLHADYQQFVLTQFSLLSNSELRRFSQFEKSLKKLTSLNLDPLEKALSPYYSLTGRPATFQPEIFRSFILMLDLGEKSLTNWIRRLRSDHFLAFLIGCTPDKTPSLGSHYDFINRLWLRHKSKNFSSRKLLHSYNKNFSKGKKPGKNIKLPNRHMGIVKRIVDFYLAGRSFSARYEKLLQEIFTLIAVVPSINLGLIPSENLTIAGDGTSLHCHSSRYGSKVCECRKNGIYDCTCDRRFSDPDATNGWDSHLAQWYHGYTLYALSSYNLTYKVDLPLYLRFVGANRHDSVTGIVALAEFRELLPTLQIQNLCLDSANDNYPTYDLCKEWAIRAFIDLNSKRGPKIKYPAHLSISDSGTPICAGGHKMSYDGYCPGRSRHKWRCPLKRGLVTACNANTGCSQSDYGRVLYINPEWDSRLFTPIPRGTKAFKEIYKTRTCAERINNRILNDYNLEDLRIRGKKRFSFFTMMIGINLHLDALIKKKEVDHLV